MWVALYAIDCIMVVYGFIFERFFITVGDHVSNRKGPLFNFPVLKFRVLKPIWVLVVIMCYTEQLPVLVLYPRKIVPI